MRGEPIVAVCLDAGGTLLSARPSLAGVYDRTLAPLGLVFREEEYLEAARATWSELEGQIGQGRDRFSYFPGGEREYWRRYVRRVLDRLGSCERAEEAAEALYDAFSEPDSWQLYSEVRPTLHALRERGFRLAVISNWDSRLPGLLEALGLTTEFEAIVVSSKAGVEKPAPAIYQQALARLGLEPRLALHVGDDRVADYEGPIAAGLRALLLVRNGPAPVGLPAIRSLDALMSLLPDGPAQAPPEAHPSRAPDKEGRT